MKMSRMILVLACLALIRMGRSDWTPTVVYAMDVTSAAVSRGGVVEDRPTRNSLLVVEWGLGAFGRIGALHWDQSDLTDRSPYWHRCYSEHDWAAYYGYDFELTEGWTLTNEIMVYWMVYGRPRSGYDRLPTDYEWDWSGRLSNPYLIPYWRVRAGANQGGWTASSVGLKREIPLSERFALTPEAFLELGDGRMNEYRFARGADRNHQTGVQTYNGQLTLTYSPADCLTFFIGCRQLVTATHHNRRGRSHRVMTARDLTIGTAGFRVSF